MKKLILFLFTITLTCMAHADVNSDLSGFFDGLGMVSNVTAPRAYKGQQAGYYTGGSLFARSAVRNVQMVQVDLPSFRAGCGGIDLFAGGFSYIDHDDLIKTMRNILNGAKGYAMLLALEEVTPQIANGMKYMQDMANKINQMNIHSCETAESLVGGMWPKTRAAQQQVCQDVGTNTGLFSDWAASRQGCRSSDFESTMHNGAKNAAYKNMVLDNGNIAWKALQENHLVTGDTQLAELLMSLSGSIILDSNKTGGGSVNFTYLPSLSSDESLIKAIMNGDKATLYKCDEPTLCLHPTKQVIAISKDNALTPRVERLLTSMSQKILTDTALSPEEMGLLQSTRIPIYKVLAVQAAYEKDPNILNVENYAETIATDILFQYLEENINLVRYSSNTLQYPDAIMKQFTNDIETAMSDVRNREHQAEVRLSNALQLIEQTQVIEKMLASQLSSEVGNSLTWAKSLR